MQCCCGTYSTWSSSSRLSIQMQQHFCSALVCLGTIRTAISPPKMPRHPHSIGDQTIQSRKITKTYRSNVYPHLVSSACEQRGLLLTNSSYSVCNLQSSNLQSATFNLQSGLLTRESKRKTARRVNVHTGHRKHTEPLKCRHKLSCARCGTPTIVNPASLI